MEYITSLIEGILTFISPCILPMIPVYLVYLAGEEQVNGSRRLFFNSIGFVIGFTIVFVSLGAGATSLGHFLKAHHEIIRKISGIIMVIFGLNFIGIFKFKLINFNLPFNINTDKLKFPSAILFGITFSFSWTPCLTSFLGSILLLASNSGTMAKGITMLFVYSMGLGIPFIITAMIFDTAKTTIEAIKKHNRLISLISGIILIIAGILVFFDRFKYLNNILT